MSHPVPSLKLHPGREKAPERLHPWIYSGAVREIVGDPAPGETIDLISHQGEWLAKAAYSPHSQIRARIWTWDPEISIDQDFFNRRMERAYAARQVLMKTGVDAYRVIHGESDGLPGLVIDRYAGWLVIQFLSAGAEYWRDQIIAAARDVLGFDHLYERSDSTVREMEGLQQRAGLILGAEEPAPVIIHEGKMQFEVDLIHGQKTGFYLDQREHRTLVQDHFSHGNVLNVFCYTGGFTVAALFGNAERVLSVDSSSLAISGAKRNIARNKLPETRCEWLVDDAFQALRKLHEQGHRFDTIYVDPPRFAPTASQAHRAARGYKDLNRLAFLLLKPGGTLVTFSCSGGVTSDLFQKVVADAALDAGREGRILRTLSQPADHPIALGFPEGRYLKGLVVLVE